MSSGFDLERGRVMVGLGVVETDRWAQYFWRREDQKRRGRYLKANGEHPLILEPGENSPVPGPKAQ